MYNVDGVNVGFTVSETGAIDHIATLHEYIAHLKGAGYSPQLPGLESGEESQEVDGWVFGVTSREEACVYLYKSPLKWKVATVYIESLDMLPFEAGGKQWPGSAPERETAVNRGYMNQCPPFKVVMVPTGKMSDNGHKIMRFNRVLDAAPASKPPVRTNKATPPTGTRQTQSDKDFESLPSQGEKKTAVTDGDYIKAALASRSWINVANNLVSSGHYRDTAHATGAVQNKYDSKLEEINFKDAQQVSRLVNWLVDRKDSG
ncbi:MAG: hypothetical protein GY938_27210 [Ketobacter sp.]|nr:hypothetical protein [Ketobacter sp.]